MLSPDLYLGSCVDSESNGQPDINAGIDATNGDDNQIGSVVYGQCANGNDEDGITMVTPLIPGSQACVVATIHNTGAPARLYGWVDFNGDGDFQYDPNEWLNTGDFAGGGHLVTGSVQNKKLCFDVPADATFNGGQVYMRFRLTRITLAASEWRGPAPDGEVEDYWQKLYCVGNYIWDDTNGNEANIQDSADSGIPNVTIRLVWGGPNNTIDTHATDPGAVSDDMLYTTVSDSNGVYSFCGLTSSVFSLQISSPPAGMMAITHNQGADDTRDSDGIPDISSIENPVDGPTFTIQSSVPLPISGNGNHDSIVNAYNFPDDQTNLTYDFGFQEISTSAVLTKRVNTPGTIRPGDPVSFTITITNTGNTWLAELPVTDVYDTNYLSYGYQGLYATPASNDTIDDGRIDWSDITSSLPFGQLAPGGTTQIIVWFTAKQDTSNEPTGETRNMAYAHDILIDPDGPDGAFQPQSIDAQLQDVDFVPVKILQPTGLFVTSFAASTSDEDAVLTWETSSELNIAGFQILRRRVSGEQTTPVGDFIPAQWSGMDRGGEYTLRDPGLPTGLYDYILQTVLLDGRIVNSEVIHVLMRRSPFAMQ